MQTVRAVAVRELAHITAGAHRWLRPLSSVTTPTVPLASPRGCVTADTPLSPLACASYWQARSEGFAGLRDSLFAQFGHVAGGGDKGNAHGGGDRGNADGGGDKVSDADGGAASAGGLG